jgi:hypothetical protein
MAAITDLDDLALLLSGGGAGAPENPWFMKAARVAGVGPTSPVAGRPLSLWKYDGLPGAGVNPTTVAVPTNATAGSLGQADPGGIREKFLHCAWGTGLVAGTLVLYDRLLHIGGLSGTVTTAQTVGGTLTRYTTGENNFIFAEIYTTVGTTGTTITASYTDEAGNTGNTTAAVAFGATGFREDTRVIFLPLASGDKGVRAVASTTVLATTGTAGNFGITVGHPIATIDINGPGMPSGRTFAQGLPGFPEILPGACLAWLFIPFSTTVPEFFGGLGMVEK